MGVIPDSEQVDGYVLDHYEEREVGRMFVTGEDPRLIIISVKHQGGITMQREIRWTHPNSHYTTTTRLNRPQVRMLIDMLQDTLVPQ